MRARALVNAAGPWVDGVLAATGRNHPASHHARLVKGSHIVFRSSTTGPQCYTLQSADGRVVFTIPYEDGFTLVGTTDVPFDGDPARCRAIATRRRSTCAACWRTTSSAAEAGGRRRGAYAGVRPLADSGQENASAVTRDYVFDLERRTARRSLSSLRRQDHHLPQAGRARADATSARRWAIAARPGPRRATLPGGDLPGADFDAFRAAGCATRWPWLPAGTLDPHGPRLRLARWSGCWATRGASATSAATSAPA